MSWVFEDYEIETGYTNANHTPYASLREFFALVATGATHEEAIANLRAEYDKRVHDMREEGRPVPVPGQREEGRFAPDDKIQALRPFVDEFWDKVLGTSYSTSFVSNESRFSSWEHYLGGRDELIQRVLTIYGVDISSHYDEPIPTVLARVRERQPTNGFKRMLPRFLLLLFPKCYHDRW